MANATLAGWGARAAGPLLTLDEAAEILDPPISRQQLKSLVEALGIPPAGTRRKLGPGRPALTYCASELMKAHAAVASWIAVPVTGAA